MRIVFMGTPDFAVPSLKRLIADGHDIAAVYTQPDKPKNRGMKLTPSPVKVVALEHNIPVCQPVSFRQEGVFEEFAAFKPELVVVAAYGMLLPQNVLDEPKLGCINVHSSLLPQYRGAAPINWAMVNGDKETGVTIMHMALKLDAGDIISQAVTPIEPNENVEALHDRLSEMGAELLSTTVTAIGNGTATRTPQGEEFTYAPKLSRELCPLDWNKSAQQLHDQIRGLVPWPATTMELGGMTIKVYKSSIPGESTKAAPGTPVRADKKGLLMACGDGQLLRIEELQAPGKKRMRAADYLRGHQLF